MSALKLEMSVYEIERKHLANDDYSEEVLYANWNPSLYLARREETANGVRGVDAMPADLAALERHQLEKKLYHHLSFE